jgi:hypothetical protein
MLVIETYPEDVVEFLVFYHCRGCAPCGGRDEGLAGSQKSCRGRVEDQSRARVI